MFTERSHPTEGVALFSAKRLSYRPDRLSSTREDPSSGFVLYFYTIVLVLFLLILQDKRIEMLVGLRKRMPSK